MFSKRSVLRFALVAMGVFVGLYLYRRGVFHRTAPRVIIERTTPSEVLPVLPLPQEVSFSMTRESIQVGAHMRQYLLVVPKPLTPGLPLVFVAHGDGGDGPGFERASPFERASGKGAVVVYPSGLRATWDIETAADNADHALLEAIAARSVRELNVDAHRVFGTGYSSGAFLMNFMACAHPGFFRAIASNAGSAPYLRAETFPNGYTKCRGQAPLPMLALHGTSDFAVTLQSGRFSADYWAYVNGCDLHAWETTGYPECRAFQHCLNGNDVAYCEIEGLGHWVWDHHAEATWSFFLQHGANPDAGH